ncbi:hypothetical protein [Chryseobacterium sp. R2A-55]|uniref:hypothetical protein n=1 Tax=Chryseobacterium sp. R2A-55 TaxID=2744445 RepID=UPI001F1577BE|nr:hypothetical protein [Chryseobacterium sp. R2A-55]
MEILSVFLEWEKVRKKQKDSNASTSLSTNSKRGPDKKWRWDWLGFFIGMAHNFEEKERPK